MSFNYSKERRKFESEWKTLRAEYRAAGFPEDKIDAMYAFDEEVFRSQRRYKAHNQLLPYENFGGDDQEYRTILFSRFEQLSVFFDENDFHGRYAWVDTIGSTDLVSRIKTLTQSDLELLTLFAIDGLNIPCVIEHLDREN